MEKFVPDFQALVIGNKEIEHIQKVLGFLEAKGITYTHGSDVYDAAYLLATSKAKQILVIGFLLALSAENFKLVEVFRRTERIQFCALTHNCSKAAIEKLTKYDAEGRIETAATQGEAEWVISKACRNDAVGSGNDKDFFHNKIAGIAETFFISKPDQGQISGRNDVSKN